MTQALFIDTPVEFPKLAAETSLPEDPNMWSDEVLQELYKQVPYLSDFDLEVVMETVDGERGYGLGHVEVSSKSEAPMDATQGQRQAAGIRTARIPVIVRDSRLQPFDVVITDDSKMMPLTESRLRQAMFRPQNFDVTSKTPGDQSMIGQLYPPFRQNYGFGGGGVTMNAGMGAGKTAEKIGSDLEAWLAKEAADQEKHSKADLRESKVTDLQAAAAEKKESCGYQMKTGSVLTGVLPSANVSDLDDFKSSLLDQSVRVAYINNPAAYDAIEKIANAPTTSLEKRASAIPQYIKPSVLQVTKLADGYAIKTASHRAWAPLRQVVDRGELVRRVGEKVALAADMSGAVTVSDGPGVSEEESALLNSGPISTPGMYNVQTADGQQLSGSVIPNLLDIDGKPLPIALFTDGMHAAVQADISGERVGDFQMPGLVPAEQASGRGVFVTESAGAPMATLPLSIGASIQNPGTDQLPRYQAETFDGRPVQVSVQPYVESVLNAEGVMLIPQGWMWLPLDGTAETALAESPEEVQKVGSLRRTLASVEVAGSADCFSIRGHAVDKLAADDREFLSQDDALFILTALGASPTYAQAKLAAAASGTPKSVRIGRFLKTAEELQGESYLAAERYLSATPVFRHRLWKEAAVIPDPVAVDSVLSLGFINPENIATFVGYLPTLDEAQRRLCELLVAARLGLQELSEGAIERAMRALEDVIEGLKVVAFQG